MAEPTKPEDTKPQDQSQQDQTKDTAGSDDNADTQPSDTSSKAQDTQTKDTSSISEDTSQNLKEDIRKDVSESVSKEVSDNVIQKIGKALGLTKEESEEELPNDPKKLQEYINKQVEQRFQKQQETQQQEEEQTNQQRQEKINGIITSWHSQYNNLARQGKVPEIKDANDQNDPGVQARRKLIQEIGNMIEENKKSGDQTVASYTPTVQDAILKNPSLTRGVPGGNLPISGNTSSREDENAFSNKEIKNKSFVELAAEGAL